MNGAAFQGLSKLSYVDLSRNICIDEAFEGSTQVASLPEMANEKCEFKEEQ